MTTQVAAAGTPGGTRDYRWPEAGVSRVPYWVYTDPAIYQREQERIFRGASWSYVGLVAEVPEPGDFKRTTIGDKPVVLVRDKDGALNVFENRCAHRGVQFCQTHDGNASEFMCPYHQWTYGLKGDLIGVPFRRGVKEQGGMPPDFDPKDHGLRKLKVTERGGVIFASFDLAMEPFEDVSRSHDAAAFRPGFRRTKNPGARQFAAGDPGELEAHVREHQGPVSREPAARVPGVVRPLPRRSALAGTRGRHGPPRRADLAKGRTAGWGSDGRDEVVQGRLQAAGSDAAAAGEGIQGSEYRGHDHAVAQSDHPAAVEYARDAPTRDAWAGIVRTRVDVLRLCRRQTTR